MKVTDESNGLRIEDLSPKLQEIVIKGEDTGRTKRTVTNKGCGSAPTCKKSCPNCKKNLETHTHEQMLQCISEGLSRWDRETGDWVFD